MNWMFLTQVGGILKPFAWIMGMILNAIYKLVAAMGILTSPVGNPRVGFTSRSLAGLCCRPFGEDSVLGPVRKLLAGG